MEIGDLAGRLPTTPALSKSVTDALREMIVRGAVSPSQHLKEAELSTALGVSRGPVREALVQLESEGFVELRRHRGAFVVELTDRDVEEVYSLRVALESLAMERAATRMTPEHFAQMDAVLARMKRVKRGYSANDAVDLDLAFHDIIYVAADHVRLRRSWEFIRSQVAFFLHTRNVQYRDFLEVGYEEHKTIRDVLAAGDSKTAGLAIQQHVSGAYRRLMHDHHDPQPAESSSA